MGPQDRLPVVAQAYSVSYAMGPPKVGFFISKLSLSDIHVLVLHCLADLANICIILYNWA